MKFEFIKQNDEPIMIEHVEDEQLAYEIDEILYDYDTYGYWDAVDSTENYRAQTREEILNDIGSGYVDYLLDNLSEIAEEAEESDIVTRAVRLKQQLIRRKNK